MVKSNLEVVHDLGFDLCLRNDSFSLNFCLYNEEGCFTG